MSARLNGTSRDGTADDRSDQCDMRSVPDLKSTVSRFYDVTRARWASGDDYDDVAPVSCNKQSRPSTGRHDASFIWTAADSVVIMT